MLQPIFDTCDPRPDILSGTTKDEEFAADLAKVIQGTAPPEYSDPATFFARTHPTRGIKELLKAVCTRLSGEGGEVASIIRLDTQYGGGKTHGLIALVHAVRGASFAEISEFVNPAILPSGRVRLAAIDGENSDPANGLRLEDDLFAHSIWGEIAYRLAGREGYERVRNSDEKHIAPGAETIKELFGGEPTLVVIDEISVYLRKVERAFPGAADQFTAFIHALCKAVESSPRVALVYTLALGKDDKASDAYREENERAAAAFAEVEHVAARKATHLNPTEEDETADVLRRRLFADIAAGAAKAAVEEYSTLWRANRDSLPHDILTEETREQFLRGYPLHPELLNLLTLKTSTLSTFQRTRGMLRLLAGTVHRLWADRPKDAFAIHVHHVPLGFERIRYEVTDRVQQKELVPALNGDVEAVPGAPRSIAQALDTQYSPPDLPLTVYIARTAYLNTLAYNPELKGIAVDRLKWSIASPGIEPSFVEQARARFVAESDYLDDSPGAPLRFMAEPNLVQMIRKQMRDIEAGSVKAELDARIKDLFRSSNRFDLVAFPGGPHEAPDDPGGRPLLVLPHWDAMALAGEPREIPSELADLFRYKGANNAYRELRNHLVFLVADEGKRENMRTQVRRRLALVELRKPVNIKRLADYQQRELNVQFEGSAMAVAEAILHCYRHLFYPSGSSLGAADVALAYSVIEIPNASDRPGQGLHHVARHLHDHRKLLAEGDEHDAPHYVRDQTPLRIKGSLSTQELRNEFRRNPKLSILLSDDPLIACIRDGVAKGVFVYREGEQVWGEGDPAPVIHIRENAYVHTANDAKNKHLWPRPAPLRVTLRANPSEIAPGESATLLVEIHGGVAPYEVVASEAGLSVGETSSTSILATVSPPESQSYEVKVKDVRGTELRAEASVSVRPIAAPGAPGAAPAPPRPPTTLVSPSSPSIVAASTASAPRLPREDPSAEGPLAPALAELFEKARRSGIRRIRELVIKFESSTPAFKVQNAIATLTEVETVCAYDMGLESEGVDEFIIKFKGRLDRTASIKPFLDAQLRSAKDTDFQATYTLTFLKGQATDEQAAEKLGKDLTRYGAGEAFVEARASTDPEEEKP